MSASESCISSESEIAAAHVWKRGETAQVGSAPNEKRFTFYRCVNCGWLFKHQYNIIPDIALAMEKTGVPRVCTLPQPEETNVARGCESTSCTSSASSSEEEEEE